MSATRHTKALRAYYYQGKLIPIAETKELPTAFALEMRAAGKLEITEAPAKVAVPTSSDNDKEKGGKNAR